MKQVILLTALATLIATPALAKTHHNGQNAMAFVGESPDAVNQYGKVVGQDPDPNVRLQLRKTAGAGHD